MKRGTLILEDGSKFDGFTFGASTNTAGEVVCHTGMVGYVESLTDPSYCGQILVLTFPLIGNYGVPDDKTIDDFGILRWVESNKIYASALIVSAYTEDYSHWNAIESLSSWLKKHNVPGLYGIDTRTIAKNFVEDGTMLGKIVMEGTDPKMISFHDQNRIDLMTLVSIRNPRVFNPTGKISIVCIDCGLKNNQLRILCQLNAKVTIVPWNHPVKQDEFDGLFLSSGPGDPQIQCSDTIVTIKSWIDSETIKPIFGIGLGHQLMALAVGMKITKLKYGHRGHNQSCILEGTQRCFITSENHGFTVETLEGLAKDWSILFRNQNDQSNEGIVHDFKPFFSVQFNPDHCAGPRDTENLFQIFLDIVQSYKVNPTINVRSYLIEQLTKCCSIANAPSEAISNKINKILILGNGRLIEEEPIGLDFLERQLIDALNEEQIKTVLLNPAAAPYEKSADDLNQVVDVGLHIATVEWNIEVSKPNGILISFGGQTALRSAVKLCAQSIFKKYRCNILGTPIESIEITQDNCLFTKTITDIGEKVVSYEAANSLEETLISAERLGYPVYVRATESSTSLRQDIANNREQLISLVTSIFADSSQLLIRKSVQGWKKVEYEVVRDQYDNCIMVWNMEYLDPLAVRTGDSIIVMPSQTLSNDEFYLLRNVSMKVARYLNIVGQFNIQFALNPLCSEYYIIRVHPRLTCSSVFASQATGYPLAYVISKVVLGISLVELEDTILHETYASIEPNVDYVAIKVPRLDLQKIIRDFNFMESSVKSAHEIISIGRSFEEAFQKALRKFDKHITGFDPYSETITDYEISTSTDERIFILATALHQGYTIDRLFQLTKIDRWFLHKYASIIQFIRQHSDSSITQDPLLLLQAKRLGFSDKQISKYSNCTEIENSRVFNPTGKISIVCIDCGLKNNQLRILCQLNAKVTIVPWNHPVKQDEFDGLFLSSGPGDP
ncbi:unnamed protein product, partial [Rotaria magnacalcarata]